MKLFGKLAKVFRNKAADIRIAEMEDTLLESGLSPRIVFDVISALEDSLGLTSDFEKISQKLHVLLRPLLLENPMQAIYARPTPTVYLFVGVNGVGKTTSIAKYAHHLMHALSVPSHAITLAAGDTFRAAASLQLDVHAQNLSVRCIKQHDGADPAAVIYDAISHAKNTSQSYVLADTAGRMNTRKDLIMQLQKVYRIAQKDTPEKNIVVFIVIDGNSGLNTIQQVEDFKMALPIDGLILSKYDGSTRGGVIMSIAQKCMVPCVLLGTGERYSDLCVFNKESFLHEFLAQE